MARPYPLYDIITKAGDSFQSGIFATNPVRDGTGNDFHSLLQNGLQTLRADNATRMRVGTGIGATLASLAANGALWGLADYPAKIGILALGQNDYGSSDTATFTTNVQTALDYYKNNCNAQLVVLAIPNQRDFSADRKAGQHAWNEIYEAECASRGFLFVWEWEWALLLDGETVSADCPRKAIASLSGDGATVTVNTSSDHGFTTGDTIVITGTDNFDNEYDGAEITVTAANIFTYADTVNTTEVPSGTAYAAKPINAFVPAAYNPDSYHPNDTGYNQMYTISWERRLQELFSQAQRRPITSTRATASRSAVSSPRELA